ncbi:MAG: 30S ribosomal protein S6 [Dehalococcoidia bacterium]|nr:30S ribosomal protein S6 [Dehalococcoidia bacterium]
MREYELTVIYDLAVAESGGADASVDLLTSAIEARGGRVLRVDHWGRRRMAYPINKKLDGDYIVSRVELDPEQIRALEGGFRIDERIYRHLVVRADELPVPPPPREPRRPQGEERPAPADAAPAATAPVAPAADAAPAAPVAEATGAAEAPATTEEAGATGAAGDSPAPVASENAPEPGSAPESGTIAGTEANA